MNLMKQFSFWLWILIQLIFIFYFLLPGILLLFHFGKKLLFPSKLKVKFNKDFDFAAIVTAHQDTRFIKPLVDSFLKQKYQIFTVYIIADDCDTSDLNFTDNRIKILTPTPPLHAKISSIKFAIQSFQKNHDVIVIFDSDNLIHPQYFSRLNLYFKAGYHAVQTHMISKNIDTIYAKLDTIGHVYNTFVERESRMDLGVSSSILGLGIAVKTSLYQEILYRDGLGGFDKKLQSDLAKKVTIAFADDAFVYDEKVEDGATLEKQRTRWLYAYFKYFKANWDVIKYGITHLKIGIIYFGLNIIKPPLFILLGIGFIFFITNLFLSPMFAKVWLFIFFWFILSFLAIVYIKGKQIKNISSLIFVPNLIFRQLKAMFRMNTAKKYFIKTEHNRIIYIKDILKDEAL